jgi:hypothetical protein
MGIRYEPTGARRIDGGPDSGCASASTKGVNPSGRLGGSAGNTNPTTALADG